jgi:hypothetical protein
MFGESTGTDRSTTAPTPAPPRQKRKREPNDYRDSAFYMAHERPVDKGALAAAASDEYLRVHVYILPVSFRHVAALQQELAAAIARADTAEQECERLAVVSVSQSGQVSALSLLY